MSLRKRGKTWWVDFTAPNGQRIRKPTGTGDKTQAQEYHDWLKAEYWRQCKLKEPPRRTWQEAAVKWLHERSYKRTHQGDISKLKWCDQHLRGKYLDEIDRELIESIAAAKEAEGSSPATVNRYLALIRAILQAACFEWEWIVKAPKIRLRKEANKRVRILTDDEAKSLMAVLPGHLADMMCFSLATGLRMNNVVGLQWSQVDLEKNLAWIHPDQSKTGKPIGVPLNDDAMEVLRKRWGKHETYVFTYHGQPVQRASNHAWYKAMKRAGIKGFRWHDLRHTWATRHALAGTPLDALQELGGWKSQAMVKRYAHLTAGHLRPYTNKICLGTNLSQPEVSEFEEVL